MQAPDFLLVEGLAVKRDCGQDSSRRSWCDVKEPTEAHHYSIDELQAWLAGNVETDPSQEAAIGDHLAVCERCGEQFAELFDPRTEFRDLLVQAGERLAPAARPIENLPTLPTGSDRWQVQSFFARGGIGEVYLASDRKLHRTVILKKLQTRYSGSAAVQERFLGEANITAGLDHPGVPTVFDVIDAGSDSFYVMQWVRGQPLSEVIAQLYAQPLADCEYTLGLHRLLGHWLSVGRTISYAHQRGVLHRDLKSSNVIIGDNDQVSVIDWGLAKRDDQAEIATAVAPAASLGNAVETVPGARLGTPAFMAPEQVHRDLPLTRRTDVWGMGAMLYEMLTGQPPFSGGDTERLYASIVQHPPQSIELLNRRSPETLNAICRRALAKNPADRYDEVAEMVKAVEMYLNGERLRQQRARALKELFDMTDDLMCVYYYTSRTIWINSAYSRKLGYRGGEHDDPFAESLVHPDDMLSDDLRDQLRRGETIVNHEIRLRDSAGSYHWYSWTLTPILSEAAVYGVGRSIDDRVRSMQNFENLLNCHPDAVIVFRRTGQILMADSRAHRLLKFDSPRLNRLDFLRLLPTTVPMADEHVGGGEPFVSRSQVAEICAESTVLANAETHEPLFDGLVCLIGGDDEPVAVRLMIKAILFDAERVLVAILRSQQTS